MIEDDPFFYWRIAAEISVENAAILMVGGDPEETEPVHIGPFPEDYAYQKRTTSHKGFQSALSSLTAAIISGEISVRVRYRPDSKEDSDVCRTIEVGAGGKDCSAKFLSFGEGRLRIGVGTVSFLVKPDWTASMIKVNDLRDWLRSKGVNKSIFFDSSVSEIPPYQNPEHEHFAPELDFAVTAWRALETTRMGKQGSKALIERWLDEHSDQWRGKGEVSTTTKERIAIVMNWRKAGAVKSGE